jgi:uncharacterized membrane protein required for colicin V production
MAFLLTIIAGAVAAWFGRRKGFVTMWVMLFNVLISIYLSILLSPTLIGYISALNSSGYYRALTLLFVAILVFLCLHNLVNMFLAIALSAELPKLCDGFGAGVLGFLAGHFASGFLIFVLGLFPPLQADLVKELSGGDSLSASVTIPVKWSCSTAATISFQSDRDTHEDIINWYLTGPTGLSPEPTTPPSALPPGASEDPNQIPRS